MVIASIQLSATQKEQKVVQESVMNQGFEEILLRLRPSLEQVR